MTEIIYLNMYPCFVGMREYKTECSEVALSFFFEETGKTLESVLKITYRKDESNGYTFR